MRYAPPDFSPPYRVLVRGAATRGWYEAPAAERSERILPLLERWLARWGDLDAVPALMQEVRDEVDGASLDRWFRFEARVGRPLFLAGDAA